MDKYRHDRMLTLRISEDLYDRLSQLADSEERTISNIARLMVERGLEAYQLDGRLYAQGTAQARGEAFERAVLGVLIAHGLIEASKANQDAKKSIRDEPQKQLKSITKKKLSG